MNGLYALKPWYGRRLTGVRRQLVARRVSPSAMSSAAIGFAGAAAVVTALAPAHPLVGIVVGALLAGRLACANLDGAIARETGRAGARGALVNEVSDRVADLLVIAAFVAHAPAWLVALTAVAATMPSWTSLAGVAAGASRLQGGPLGKTERCLLAAVGIGTGLVVPVLAIIAVGSAVTAALRFARLWSGPAVPR